ncbi:hypothetical protein KUW17_02575 [Leisingera aquaemixtae]|uniref:hypothetical protein n=1 Tax=Leisingera aquaemixtae TaxID=1396826 RepID=UPI001C9876FE|nr:hypothetical protein [Leisingera aquaemixtae]MBY6065608.1 hypothetical protein [Leisingera aquaemixtae]
MHTVFKFLAAFGAIAALTGCVSPEQFETAPVQLRTSKGIVTCQLYTKERVLWDRSIDRPASMTVQEADDICKREGYRQKKEG